MVAELLARISFTVVAKLLAGRSNDFITATSIESATTLSNIYTYTNSKHITLLACGRESAPHYIF